jgi:transcriptional regulator with XRE-family HTH domain
MDTQMTTIASGFGNRLREERERLGLTQAQLAEAAGIQRLAQGQYENEIRSPTVKYLSAIGCKDVDLSYVLFGRPRSTMTEDQRSLEKRVFDWVERYAQNQPDGKLGAEARYAMFEFLRNYLTGADEKNSASLDPLNLVAESLFPSRPNNGNHPND